MTKKLDKSDPVTGEVYDPGFEYPDPTPVAIPVGYTHPPTLQEEVARLFRDQQFKAYIEAQGGETFEEAEDFDVGDDFDPFSPWEYSADDEHNFRLSISEPPAPKPAPQPTPQGGPAPPGTPSANADGAPPGGPSKAPPPPLSQS